MVDLFTRHVELAPMRDQTANTILGTIDDWIFRGHYVPDIVLSDQGPSVDEQEFRSSAN